MIKSLSPHDFWHERFRGAQALHHGMVELEPLQLPLRALNVVLKELHPLLNAAYKRLHFHQNAPGSRKHRTTPRAHPSCLVGNLASLRPLRESNLVSNSYSTHSNAQACSANLLQLGGERARSNDVAHATGGREMAPMTLTKNNTRAAPILKSAKTEKWSRSSALSLSSSLASKSSPVAGDNAHVLVSFGARASSGPDLWRGRSGLPRDPQSALWSVWNCTIVCGHRVKRGVLELL